MSPTFLAGIATICMVLAVEAIIPDPPCNFHVYKNRTSVGMTVSWTPGIFDKSTSTFWYKKQTDSIWILYAENLPDIANVETLVHVYPLEDCSVYEFRVQASSIDLVPEYSAYVYTEGNTPDKPDITIVDPPYVTLDAILVTWVYNDLPRSKKRVSDASTKNHTIQQGKEVVSAPRSLCSKPLPPTACYVVVRFRDVINNSSDWERCPQVGKEYAATEAKVCIAGEFNVSRPYEAKLEVYERDIPVFTYEVDPVASVPEY